MHYKFTIWAHTFSPIISLFAFLKICHGIFFFLTLFYCSARAQTVSVSGAVKGDDGKPLERVAVAVKENPNTFTYTDEKGNYILPVEINKTLTLIFFDINHTQITFTFASHGENISYSPIMKFKNELGEVSVTDFKN